jgi:preprotein translocase subunit SecA
VVLPALILVPPHWGELAGDFSDRVLAVDNLLLLWLVFPLIKAAHEFGHAMATKRGGGEVHDVGVVMLVLLPVPYVEASASSVFRSRFERAMVGAAGMVVELFIAAIAFYFWLLAEPGPLRAVLFNVMVVAGVSTLLFNGNPLLRYDAYYILADLIEMPNLASRSLKYWGHLIERHAFGVESDPPSATRGEKAWLAFYGIGSTLYRIFVTIGIAWFIAGEFFFIGVVLALWAVFAMAVLPLGKALLHVAGSPRLHVQRKRVWGVVGGTVAALLLGLFVLPFPSRTMTEGVVWLPDDALVRASNDGFVERLLATPGSPVQAGQPLVEMREPVLEADLRVARAKLAEAQALHAARMVDDRVQAGLTLDQLEAARTLADELERRSQDLTLVAATAGTFVVPASSDAAGRHRRKGELVGYVIDKPVPLVRVVVTQGSVDLVRNDTRGVQVQLAQQPGTVLEAQVAREVPGGAEYLPSRALSAEGGGTLPTDPRDPKGGGRTLERTFQFDLRLPADATGHGRLFRLACARALRAHARAAGHPVAAQPAARLPVALPCLAGPKPRLAGTARRWRRAGPMRNGRRTAAHGTTASRCAWPTWQPAWCRRGAGCRHVPRGASSRRPQRCEVPLEALADDELRRRAAELRPRLRQQGFTLANAAQAFALIRVAASRTLRQRHYDEQLIAGYGMLQGRLVEMATGEGKTFSATLPACTVAMAGLPVHVITVNDYLASRDAEKMAPLYRFFGFGVGVVVQGQSRPERRRAYAQPITYCTNKDLAFDYLRDRVECEAQSSELHLALRSLGGDGDDTLVLRGLHYALVDEADSIFIDEARTPLILSRGGDAGGEAADCTAALGIARELRRGDDFSLDAFDKRLALTEAGKDAVARMSQTLEGLWLSRRAREEIVTQALSALWLYERDHQYVVADGKVQIVDESTGRVMPDRSWERGLHQLIEAKEGCELTARRDTIARLTYQRLFRRYLRLAGMTGTGAEVAGEIRSVYRLKTLRVPLHRPSRRIVLAPTVCATLDEKWRRVADAAERIAAVGRAVLIGTRSVHASEQVSAVLAARGIAHVLLNAKQDEAEADVVARAGQAGAVTVATNMAGRGTDIELDAQVHERGGLHVILTEFHESRRVDRQLFGRAARQGDPGSCEAIVSLEDEIFTLCAPGTDPLGARLQAARGHVPVAGAAAADAGRAVVGRAPQRLCAPADIQARPAVEQDAGFFGDRRMTSQYKLKRGAAALFVSLAPFAAQADPYECLIEPSQVVEIRSSVEGVIDRIQVRRGDRVKAGQALVQLESAPEASALDMAKYRSIMEGRIASARNRLEFATKKSARAQELKDKNFLAVQASTRPRPSAASPSRNCATRSRTASWRATTRSTRRPAEPAHAAQPVQRRRRRPDAEPGRPRGIGHRPQADPEARAGRAAACRGGAADRRLRKDQAGSSAQVMPESIGGRHPAKVTIVDSVFDSASGTFGVRLEIANANGVLPAGIRCQVEFTDAKGLPPRGAKPPKL